MAAVKRSELPRGTFGLKAGKPLKRSGDLSRASRLSPRSKAREAAAAAERVVRELVFARDRCCLLRGLSVGPLTHRCGPVNTVHHLRKASQGGPYTPENLVTLCAVANDLVEDYPDKAWRLGLVCRRGDTLDECYERMQRAGLPLSPPG